MKKSILILIVIGIAGILDTALLVVIGAAVNTGVLLPAAIGALLLSYAFLRIKRLPFPPLVKKSLGILSITLISTFAVFCFTIFILSKSDQAVNPKRIIILGAGLKNNGISLVLEQRLKIAESYVLSHPGITIIASGGKGGDEAESEAEVMKGWFLKEHLTNFQIIVETNSTSTWENMVYSRAVISPRDLKDDSSLLIITSDFHLPRAEMLAKRAGFQPSGLPAPTPWYLLPNCMLREYFALIKSLIFDRHEKALS